MKSEDIYRTILVRMWGDEKFNRLSPLPPSGAALWIYLLTGPHSNQIGFFRAGEMTLAEELGWDLKAFRKAFRECFEEGLIKTSHDYSKDRLIFIPNFLKINFPQNPNVVKSWGHVWQMIPECQLKLEVWHHIKNIMESKDKETKAWSKAFIETCRKPSLKPFGKPFGNPLGNLSPNQEQEQEQEQEVKTPPTPPPGGNVCEGKNSEPEKRSPRDYSPEFQEFWEAYPPREGPNDKRRAFSAWKARLREDHTAEAMIAGARKYFADCASSEKIGTPYVMQASTFLGPADPPHFSVKEAPATPENIDPEKRIELWLEKVFTEHGPIVEREGESLTPDQRQAYRFKPWIVCGCPSCRKPDAWKRWYDPALPWNPKHGPIMSDCDWPYEIPMQVKYRDSPWHICRCRLCLFRDTSAMMVG